MFQDKRLDVELLARRARDFTRFLTFTEVLKNLMEPSVSRVALCFGSGEARAHPKLWTADACLDVFVSSANVICFQFCADLEHTLERM